MDATPNSFGDAFKNLRPASSPREKRSEGEHDLDNGTDERRYSPRDQISSKTGESAVSWRRSPTKIPPLRTSAEYTRRKLGGGASGAVAHDKVRTEPRLTDTNVVTAKGKGEGETTEAGSASCGVSGRQGDRTTSDAQTGPSPRSLNEVSEEMSWASTTTAVIRGSLKRTGDGHVLPNSANFERAQDKTCPSTAQGTVSSTIEQVVPSVEIPARQRFSTIVQQTVMKAPIVPENGSEIAGMSTTISTAGMPTVTETFTRKAEESRKNAGHDQAADDGNSFQLATCKNRIVSTVAAVSPFADAPSSARDPILENIPRTARSMASSCEERELVAVQVQQSAESDIWSTVAVTRKGPHTFLPSSCASVGLGASSALASSTSGSANALRIQLSPRRAPASPTPGCVNALRIKLSPRRAPASPTSGCVNALRIKLSPRRAQSPEHKRRLGEKKKRDGSPPPSCFFLPSSESKAVPLCDAAGSTTWYTGVGSRLFRGKGEEGWARSRLKELKNYRKRGASGVGGRAFWTEADCPHEEKDPRVSGESNFLL